MSIMHGTSAADASPVHGYEILQSLNEGGMGKIYLARQHALNRLVCVKVLSIPAGEDPDLCRTRFCREAELLASVSHPHILSIFDFGTTADVGLPYLVVEYIEGGDLRRRMISGQPMPVDQAQLIVRQVGDALTFLHSKGILHRDLKPENILMPTESLVKVGDFGIAVLQEAAGTLTQSERGMGTVGYVSPEQHYGLKVDERTDEYSLAAVSYELLTGRRPLGVFQPASRLNSRLTAELDAVLFRGLAEEPKDRFPSVQEFVTAFERAVEPGPRHARLLRFAPAGLSVALLAVAALAWIHGVAPKPRVMGGPSRVVAAPPALPDLASPLHAGVEPRSSALAPKPPQRSPELTRLIELRAYTIWANSGRPTGKAGESVKVKNWIEAERQIQNEVKARAFKFWDAQGRPTGPAGEAVRQKNMRAAEAKLLKETEEAMRRHPLD
jgi:serine/threonine protein kinase